MKQIAIVSGKGGTGKTTIAASFSPIAKDHLMVDCDVDAPDLEILLHPDIKEEKEFYGMEKAFIDEIKCTRCGICMENCRFDAIDEKDGIYSIDQIACEGCRLCDRICPSEAIQMKETLSGRWYISSTRYCPFVHAKLKAAEENSGKLVAVVRDAAKTLAEDRGCKYTIIDGPPGIGCPLISTVSGVDMVVVVFEPTLSGIHDAKRVIKVAEHFGTGIACIINKYDINQENTKKIEDFCSEHNLPVIGKLPYDEVFEDALVQEKMIVEVDDDIYKIIRDTWDRLLSIMGEM